MRIFFEEWKDYIPIHLLTQPIGNIRRYTDIEIRQLATDDLIEPNQSQYPNRQLSTAEIAC